MSETPLAPSEGFAELRADVVERGTAEPPKNRGGRPKGSRNKPRTESAGKAAPDAVGPRPDFLPVETVVEMVALPFDLLAGRRGEHWKLSGPEKEQIGKLAQKVISKHVPSWMDQWGDEIALGTVLGMAVLGRVMIERAQLKAAADAEPAKPLPHEFNAFDQQRGGQPL